MSEILSIISIAFTLGTVIIDIKENWEDDNKMTAVIPICEAIGSCIAAIIGSINAFNGTLTGVNVPLAIAITVVFIAIIIVTAVYTKFEREGIAVIAATAINFSVITICMFASALTPA